jgi:hypothetical protein
MIAIDATTHWNTMAREAGRMLARYPALPPGSWTPMSLAVPRQMARILEKMARHRRSEQG